MKLSLELEGQKEREDFDEYKVRGVDLFKLKLGFTRMIDTDKFLEVYKDVVKKFGHGVCPIGHLLWMLHYELLYLMMRFLEIKPDVMEKLPDQLQKMLAAQTYMMMGEMLDVLQAAKGRQVSLEQMPKDRVEGLIERFGYNDPTTTKKKEL